MLYLIGVIMKKSWMLFLLGTVHVLEAIRGHQANMEQAKARCHVMLKEDERKCAIVKATAWYCCLIPQYRTRRLVSLQEKIKVGDTIKYFSKKHSVGEYSYISRHDWLDDRYEYWRVLSVDAQNDSFKEQFIKDEYLTESEKNYEAIQPKMRSDE